MPLRRRSVRDQGRAFTLFARPDRWRLLVMLIFMHLAWDKGFHSVLIFGSLLFVWLFVGFLLIDRGQYQPTKTQFDRDVIQTQTP